MAKCGEGDKRWIVEDRPDGANVHNWHWAERDFLEWSRSLLSSLNDLTILDGEGGLRFRTQTLDKLDGEGGLRIRTQTLDKLDGEAYVNIRKGKIIPGYELSLSLSFEGEVIDSLKVTGTFEIPYIADENADEDPDIRVVIRDEEGPVGKRIKDAVISKGNPVILEKVRDYVQAMAKGGPAKDELEVKKPKAAAGSAVAAPAAAAPAASPKTEEKKEEKEEEEKEGFKTITVTEKFSCRAKDIYEILMDENRWKGFTQSNARISREVGGQFSLFDGSVTGTNEQLQEGKLIVQKWRFGSWANGIHSTVRMVFDEPEPGVTVIKLTQTNVPEEDMYGNSTVVENTESGWKDLIFQRIRAVFGFGI